MSEVTLNLADIVDDIPEEPQESHVNPAPKLRDADPSEWLEASDDVFDYFELPRLGIRFKIAALTDAEMRTIQNAAKVPPKGGGPAKTSLQAMKLLTICLSLNKANGKLGPGGQILEGGVYPQQVSQKLSGDITELYKAIAELSGFHNDSRNLDAARDFFD